MEDLTPHLVELIRSASTDLQPDVQRALETARDAEEPNSAARGALDTILENVAMSRRMSKPICQDTGTPVFYDWYPTGYSQRQVREQISQAERLCNSAGFVLDFVCESTAEIFA